MGTVTTQTKKLVVCPTCEEQGFQEILCEVVNNTVQILRYHQTYTIIQSNNFSVVCGRCNQPVLYKIENNING